MCVPTEGEKGWDESVAGQFGKARTFTLLDTSTNGVKVIKNNGGRNGSKASAPDSFAKENVEAVLAGWLGPDAIASLKGRGILVFVGAKGTVLDTVSDWRKGKFHRATLENAGEGQ